MIMAGWLQCLIKPSSLTLTTSLVPSPYQLILNPQSAVFPSRSLCSQLRIPSRLTHRLQVPTKVWPAFLRSFQLASHSSIFPQSLQLQALVNKLLVLLAIIPLIRTKERMMKKMMKKKEEKKRSSKMITRKEPNPTPSLRRFFRGRFLSWRLWKALAILTSNPQERSRDSFLLRKSKVTVPSFVLSSEASLEPLCFLESWTLRSLKWRTWSQQSIRMARTTLTE